jgi:hypothetical protein
MLYDGHACCMAIGCTLMRMLQVVPPRTCSRLRLTSIARFFTRSNSRSDAILAGLDQGYREVRAFENFRGAHFDCDGQRLEGVDGRQGNSPAHPRPIPPVMADGSFARRSAPASAARVQVDQAAHAVQRAERSSGGRLKFTHGGRSAVRARPPPCVDMEGERHSRLAGPSDTQGKRFTSGSRA